MKIKEMFRSGPVAAVGAGDSLAEAARAMASNEVGALAVLRDGKLSGILSERDIVNALSYAADPAETQVHDYMTPSPLTASPTDEAEDVIGLMVEAGVRHVPVEQDGRLVGMVSLRDLIVLALWPEPHTV